MEAAAWVQAVATVVLVVVTIVYVVVTRHMVTQTERASSQAQKQAQRLLHSVHLSAMVQMLEHTRTDGIVAARLHLDKSEVRTFEGMLTDEIRANIEAFEVTL